MKNLKFAILAAGLLGVISAFLPFISFGPESISLWEVRELDGGLVYLTMAGFLIPAIMGLLAVIKGPQARWHAIVATVFFGLALIKVRDGFQGAIGAKLMVVCAAIGLLVAIASIAKPETQATA